MNDCSLKLCQKSTDISVL